MSNAITIARPYAKAAFEIALAQNQLQSWSQFLQKAAQLVELPSVKSMLTDPNVSFDDKLALLCDEVIKQDDDETIKQQQHNFIQLLAHNKRLLYIPELASHFDELYEEQQRNVNVEITTAFPLSEDQKAMFNKALKIRLQREVTLNEKIDRSIIGGAIIHAGDRVIDGSVKSQIDRLTEELMN